MNKDFSFPCRWVVRICSPDAHQRLLCVGTRYLVTLQCELVDCAPPRSCRATDDLALTVYLVATVVPLLLVDRYFIKYILPDSVR